MRLRTVLKRCVQVRRGLRVLADVEEEDSELEFDDGRVGEDGSERAEVRESADGMRFREERDRRSCAGERIVRSEFRGGRELLLR